jgi:hypothetical protein
MKKIKLTLFLLLVSFAFHQCNNKAEQKTKTETTAAESEPTKGRAKWTEKEAKTWYAKQGWLVGANFNPSTSINQLEMWQAETFDTATINRELGWAESIGMNTARVYLHDLLHQQDSIGFYHRLETFLVLANKHGIKPLFVLFDSCWDPFPRLGKQRDPKPHVHNSGWVQSPGNIALEDTTQYARLEKYVKGVVGRFADDDRILGWDVWNEPDNDTGVSYRAVDLPNKVNYVLPLLKEAFRWCRSVNPTQPLTSGVWLGDWSSHEGLKPIEKVQLEESDIITFHNYDKPKDLEQRIQWLERYNRPIICTEYMARPNGSTFEGFLPIAKKYNVGMINWGLVDGKTQTKYPWDSWEKKYTSEPPVWFHEVFRKNGKPYREQETNFIMQLTGVEKEEEEPAEAM